MEVAGRLVRGEVAPGSKSERAALVLQADDGRVLVVRRRGAPSFGPDPSPAGAALAALAEGAGTRLRITGTVLAGTLLADTWQATDTPPEARRS